MNCLPGLRVLVLAVLFTQVAEAPAEPLANVSFAAVVGLPSGEPATTRRYGEAESQYAELWIPPTPPPTRGYPVVVMIHGGCWSNSFGLDHLGPASTALASAGFAVWAPEYRRVGDPGGGWPGSLEDILSALHALAGLRNSRLNMARVAIAGHSAGGHLALLAGANPPAPLNAAAVIGLAAITDTAAYARGDNSCERNTVAFMGSEPGARPDQWRAANPVSAATPANTLLLNGTADALVTPPQGRMNGARTITVEGAGHFDFIHPGTAAWKTFMELLEAEL